MLTLAAADHNAGIGSREALARMKASGPGKWTETGNGWRPTRPELGEEGAGIRGQVREDWTSFARDTIYPSAGGAQDSRFDGLEGMRPQGTTRSPDLKPAGIQHGLPGGQRWDSNLCRWTPLQWFRTTSWWDSVRPDPLQWIFHLVE